MAFGENSAFSLSLVMHSTSWKLGPLVYGNELPPDSAVHAEDASSHPSWLAKQKMKEKEKVDIDAFCGKKITFD